MSTDPRVERALVLYNEVFLSLDEMSCATPKSFAAEAAFKAHLESMAAEITRLTDELYDEKAVNETQRYELKERLQKQLAAEAELKEARKIVQALECLFSPYATDSTQRDWMDRAAAMTKEKPKNASQAVWLVCSMTGKKTCAGPGGGYEFGETIYPDSKEEPREGS